MISEHWLDERDADLVRAIVRAAINGRADDAVLDLKRLFDNCPYIVQVIEVEYRRVK